MNESPAPTVSLTTTFGAGAQIKVPRSHIQEVAQILAHGIRRALALTGIFRGLLGGQNLNKAFTEVVELVAVDDVL